MFQLLSYFHKHKKQNGVDAMLLKLYEPILWRSLKVDAIFVLLQLASGTSRATGYSANQSTGLTVVIS